MIGSSLPPTLFFFLVPREAGPIRLLPTFVSGGVESRDDCSRAAHSWSHDSVDLVELLRPIKCKSS